jgi:peptidoglycan hydrolase-like protein with peptidoglycan-binding domain
MNLALPLGAAAAAVLFLLSGSGNAIPGASPLSRKPPALRMAEALATGDVGAIRAAAALLRADGFASEAVELERAATTLAAQKPNAPAAPAKTPMPTPVQNPPVVSSGPNAPVLPGVPANLQGVILRRTDPVAFDPRVVTLQQRLIELGWALTADGKFGAGTETAVKEFQKLNGVAPVDGVVGPITLIKLSDANAKGKGKAAPVASSAPPPAPKPAAVPKPSAPTLPPPAPVASSGRAPTITAALRSLPAILKNGAAANYPSPASSGPAVRDWQQVLFDLGFLTSKPDGKFGSGTEVGTRQFQTAANTAAAKSGKPALTVDGKVGPATVARAAEARIMPSGPAAFTGDFFGDDSRGPVFAPSEPLADSPMPGVMPEMAPVAPNPRRALAARVYNMIALAKRGAEDRTLVRLYQMQEGLKPTGYYSPAVALSLAQSYGIVPPKPLYWTESRTSKSKSNYRDAMRMFAERDPQRVEEWQRAGEV